MVRSALLGLCLIGGYHPAWGQFEGIVESKNMTVDETGRPQRYTITMWVKADRIRTVSSASGSMPGSTMIYRKDRGIIWVLNEDERTYYVITREETFDQAPRSARGDTADRAIVRKPGRKKKILGYACEQVLVRQGDIETEIWGTRGLAKLAAAVSKVLGEGTSGAGGGLNEGLTKLGLFPLKSSSKISGTLVESQEITRIESASVSGSLFELPAGYRKQSVDDVLKGKP